MWALYYLAVIHVGLAKWVGEYSLLAYVLILPTPLVLITIINKAIAVFKEYKELDKNDKPS